MNQWRLQTNNKENAGQKGISPKYAMISPNRPARTASYSRAQLKPTENYLDTKSKPKYSPIETKQSVRRASGRECSESGMTEGQRLDDVRVNAENLRMRDF